MKCIAVTGLSGVIGQRFLSQLPSTVQVIDLFHSRPVNPQASITSLHVDLNHPDSLQDVFTTQIPDVIVHLAAITHIDRCQKEQGDLSGSVWTINVEASQKLAEVAREHGAHFTMMSTECVFNGSSCPDENASPDPINWYGTTKAEAEKRVQEAHGQVAILRSVVAYHEHDDGKTIFGQIQHSLSEGKQVSMVSDHYFAPTHTDDIVRALLKLTELKVRGIYHIAPKESITPYEFGGMVARKIGANPKAVLPVSGVEYFGEARNALRLQHSCLNSNASSKVFGFSAKSVEEVLGI